MRYDSLNLLINGLPHSWIYKHCQGLYCFPGLEAEIFSTG